MAMMVALSSAVTGLKSEQTALDVIANNIANVNTTGYKSKTVTFSDLLSQTLTAASSATSTTGGVNASQVGLGVSVSGTVTDLTVGTTSTSSNNTDVALTGAGYFVVATDVAGEYEFSRAGNLSVDDSGNLNINGAEICGWETNYTLDTDGNKVFNTDATVEPINIYSDNNKLMAAKATATATFANALDSSSTVATNATGLTSIGDTTDMDFDTTSDLTVYDTQGNDYAVTVSWKKCAVEGDTTSWYWEASAADSGATISPSSGYVAFDSDGKIVTSATTLSATVDDTAGYTSSNVSLGTGVAAGDYTVTVTGTSGAYAVTLSDGTNTYTNTTTAVDGSGTFTTSSGTITLTAPTSISTGTSNFKVTAASTALSATASTTNNTAGYASANMTAGTGVTAGTYTATVTGSAGAYSVTLSDGTNTYTNTSTAVDGSGTFTTSSGTITLAAPTSITTGSTTFTVASTTTAASAKDSEANYAYSNIGIGTNVAAGDYTVTVTGKSGAYTVTLSDGTNTYTNTSSAVDGSATFTTASGTITLSAPENIEAGTTAFTVASTTSAFDSTPTITLTTPTTAGTADVNVALDFSALKTTALDGTSTASATADGYVAGTLSSYTISTDGTIIGTYDNGKTQSIAQIALAVFDNASGLESIGDNLYAASNSSGGYSTVVAGTNGTGTMTANALELSNVDLASQFSSMMIAQRAYQANSKVITTSDEMLQSLINMK